jgi:hypothetical protein
MCINLNQDDGFSEVTIGRVIERLGVFEVENQIAEWSFFLHWRVKFVARSLISPADRASGSGGLMRSQQPTNFRKERRRHRDYGLVAPIGRCRFVRRDPFLICPRVQLSNQPFYALLIPTLGESLFAHRPRLRFYHVLFPCLAKRAATRAAATRLLASATPLPAMSYAVPWATLVRTIGKPAVMFTARRALRIFIGM